MAWPPPTFRVDYADTTPQQTEHKDVHNGVNDSLNQDFVPKINDNASRIGTNETDIAANTQNLTDHEDADAMPDVPWFDDRLAIFQLLDGSIGYQVFLPIRCMRRHGRWLIENTSYNTDATLDPNPTTSQSDYKIGFDQAGPMLQQYSGPYGAPQYGPLGVMHIWTSGGSKLTSGVLMRRDSASPSDQIMRVLGASSADASDPKTSGFLGAGLNVHPVAVRTDTQFSVNLDYRIDIGS